MKSSRAAAPAFPVPHHRLVMWLGAITLFMSLLMPMISVQTADAAAAATELAQGEPPDCEEGFTVSQDGTECVPIQQEQQEEEQPEEPEQPEESEEPEQPVCGENEVLDQSTGQCVPVQPDCSEGEIYDEASGQCVPDPAQQQEAPVYIIVNKFDCPSGTDWYQESLPNLSNGCPPNQSSIPFNVSGPGGASGQDVTSGAQWGPFDPGYYEITESVPEGYGPPIFYCDIYDPAQASANYQFYGDDSTTAGADVPSGYTFECNVYNVVDEDIYGTVIFTKFGCEAANIGEPYSATIDVLRENCQTPIQGVNYTWSVDGSTAGSLTTDERGAARWDQAPPNDYIWHEELPEGYAYAVVHCSYHEDNQGNFFGQSQPVEMVDESSFAWTLEAGYVLDCQWFNFSEPPYAQMLIEKYWCPEGYTPEEDASEIDLSGSCQGTGPQTTFSLDGPGGPYEDQTVDGNSGDTASWPVHEGGAYTVTENIPDGAYTLVAFCEMSPVAPGQENGFSFQPWEVVNGNSIQWDAEEGYYWICKIFNVHVDGVDAQVEDDYNYLDFYKYECYVTPPEGAEKGWYEDNCNNPIQGWEFDLQATEGGGTQSTDATGYTGWSGLPTGTWTATETVPEGYGEPVVWCRYTEWPEEAGVDGEWQQFETPGGQYENGFGYEGMRMECHWYNFAPEDYNYLDFYKYYCQVPAAPPEDADLSWYEENCEPVPQWDFNLQWVGGESTQTTDENGHASWSGLPTGTWTASEVLPDFYETPIVWCRYVGWPDEAGVTGEWAMFEAPDGVYENGFGYEQMRMECRWYNIWIGDEYNYLDFYKYECFVDPPPESGKEWYDQNCSPVEGWEFNLQATEGGGPETTDSNGYANWSGLPTGTWQATEFLPEGYGEPIVWCRYVEWPEEAGVTGEWAMFEAPGGAYENGFGYENMRMECHWYNFALDGNNWIDFYKLWCEEGTPYDASYEELVQRCTFGEQQVELSLSYGDETTPMSAEGQTPASWQNIPVGQWTVHEPFFEGYIEPIIWCQYIEWPEDAEGIDGEPFMLPSSDGGWGWEFEYGGLRLACAIYNIPYQANWLEITKWQCAEDIFTPYTQSADNLLEECERYTEGVDFLLEYGDESVPMTTDGEGNAEWSDIPPGQWAVQESVPEGYGEPVVYCRWLEWPEGTEFTNDPFKYQAPGGYFTGEYQYGGMRLHCDVFNIPEYDPGHITLYKWYCPEGVPRDSDPDYLRDTCEYVTTGVDFTLYYGETSVPMTTDSEGTAEWDNIPTGDWELYEPPDQGYGQPAIWCQYVGEWPEGSGIDGELFMPDTNDYRISGTFDYPGLHLVCYWFNFDYEPGDSWITIEKFLCDPSGTYADELSAYQEGCQDTMNGVSFTLTSDQYPNGSPKVTSGGMVDWTGVHDGSFTIQETLPEGYGPPKVWCLQVEYDPSEPMPIYSLDDLQPVDAADGSWEGFIEGGPLRIICHWYNIGGEDNTVTLHKYNCEYKPVGFSSLGEWLDACPNPGNGVGFDLSYGAGPQHRETSGGTAEWTGVPLGEFTLTEDPQPGYGDSVVWCGWTAYYNGAVYDAFPQNVPAPGGIYHGEITVPNTSWFCFWFNIPKDDSSVTVYKYNCPDGRLEGVVPNPLDAYKDMCEPAHGIEFTLENVSGSSSKTVMGGSTTWNDVPQGEFTLTETLPPGYDEPLWWCQSTYYTGTGYATTLLPQSGTPGTSHTGSIDYQWTHYVCWVFDFPDPDRNVIVYKWLCPEGLEPESEDYQDWRDTCTMPMSGINFTFTDGNGPWIKPTVGGTTTWYGATQGEVTLDEHIPPGYIEPIIYCSLEAMTQDGAAYAEDWTPYSPTNGAISRTIDYAEYTWVCHVFNISEGPGEITMYKWWCQPGYDINAWNADPKTDCTQAANDVPFTLDQPVGPNLMSNTGDSIPGAVHFGDLDPGAYVVTETVPPNTSYVFVLDCTGTDIDKVHPVPLSWGNVLNVDVAGGDSIVCNWYNVPDPEDGWLTVYKYTCRTETFTKEVDCEIYEFGASMELFRVEGNTSMGVGNTNAGGQYTWNDLEQGAYRLEEISHEPCHMTSSKVGEAGNPWVDPGQGTIVKVYNCTPDEPGGKIPGKYPNTGVDPAGGMRPSLQGTPPAGTPADEIEPEEFYEISCLNQEGAPASTPAATEEEDEDDSGLPPFLQPTAEEETPEADPTTVAEGTPAAGEECLRGAVPEKIVSNTANVDHEIEVLEIIDGVMQAPSGPNVVSWYKETARLGEANNVVIAGHLNFWNVPVGPFFYLNTLEEGDRIEITGEDEQTYIYEVQWVRQESNLAAPDPEVVGPTEEPSLTLITCGGEWDASIAEYNERTVVRAVQVDVIAAEQEDNENGDDTAMLLAA